MTPALTLLLQTLGIPDGVAPDRDAFISRWEAVGAAAKMLTAYEMELRKQLVVACFPIPKEGANNLDLGGGRKLSATINIRRTIDASQVAVARNEFQAANDRPIDFDELLKVEYTLVTSAYRKLVPKDGEAPSQAFLAASRMIVTKEGSPSAEIKEK